MELYIEMGYERAAAEEASVRFGDDLHAGCHWLMVRETRGHVPKKLKVVHSENTYIGSTVRFNGISWIVDEFDALHALIRIRRGDGLPARWEHISDHRIEWVTLHHERIDVVVPTPSWKRVLGRLTISTQFQSNMTTCLTTENALASYVRYGRSDSCDTEWEIWRSIIALTREHVHRPSRPKPRGAFSSDLHDFRIERMSYFHMLCDVHDVSIDAFSNCLYNESVQKTVLLFPEAIRQELSFKIEIWQNPTVYLRDELKKWHKESLPLILFECESLTPTEMTVVVKIHDMTFVTPRVYDDGIHLQLQRLFFGLEPHKRPNSIPGVMDTRFFNSVLRASKKKCSVSESSSVVPLFPYQEKCLKWLIERETVAEPMSAWGWSKTILDDGFVFYTSVFGHVSLSSPDTTVRGGLLAQDVGMGKTVEMLAMIATHKASGPTLVVVPTTMLAIWIEEAARYTPNLRVVKYHGARRTKDMNDLRAADIVVTTYRVVVNETQQHVPSIGAVRWGRIILDESHEVRSVNSVTSRAVCRLYAPLRWCVSATPWPKGMQNVSSMLAFFGVTPFIASQCNHFRCSATTPSLLCSILSQCTWWQQKRHVRLNLPAITTNVIRVTPSAGERTLYVHLTAVIQHRMELDKSVPNSRTRALHYIRWLRQAAVHPSLNRMCHYGIPSDLSVCVTETNSIQTFLDTLGTSNYDKSLTDLIHSWSEGNETCSICMDVMDRPTVTPCNHLFCLECIQTAYLHDNQRKCPLCRKPAGGAILNELTVEEPQVSSETPAKWRTLNMRGEMVEMDNCIHKSLVQMENECGTKIATFVEMVQNQKEKFILFTQFHGAWDKVCSALKAAGILYASIEGRMSPKQRAKSIRQFQTNPSIRVFVMTTKTASVGITLTAGSHIVFLEPIEDVNIRKQAIGRAWRIGQQKKVSVTTLQMRDTIDCDSPTLGGCVNV